MVEMEGAGRSSHVRLMVPPVLAEPYVHCQQLRMCVPVPCPCEHSMGTTSVHHTYSIGPDSWPPPATTPQVPPVAMQCQVPHLAQHQVLLCTPQALQVVPRP